MGYSKHFKERAIHYMKALEIDDLWDMEFSAEPLEEAFAETHYFIETNTGLVRRNSKMVFNSDECLHELMCKDDVDYVALHEVLHLYYAGIYYDDANSAHNAIGDVMRGVPFPIIDAYSN